MVSSLSYALDFTSLISGAVFLPRFSNQKIVPPLQARKILGDAAIDMRLTDFYSEKVIPAFESQGKQEATIAYGATTIARFEKLFINHKLSDMCQNRKLKIDRRYNHFIGWTKTPVP